MHYTFHHYPTLPSTNTLARQMAADGAPEGVVILADSQTAGRGRRGRSFHSPDGTGLYMSVILRPTAPPEKMIRVTTAAAVALCRALQSLGVSDTGIKWVNDVYRGGRKIAGILCEAALGERGRADYAILGVGVNLSPPEGGFPPEIASIAGTAFEVAPAGAREALARAFCREFAPLYGEMEAGGEAHLEEYRRRCFLIGRSVEVIPAGGGESHTATAEAIDGECRLVVRLPDGRREVLDSGEVSLKIR